MIQKNTIMPKMSKFQPSAEFDLISGNTRDRNRFSIQTGNRIKQRSEKNPGLKFNIFYGHQHRKYYEIVWIFK